MGLPITLDQQHSVMLQLLSNQISSLHESLNMLVSMVDSMVEVNSDILEIPPDEDGKIRDFSYRVNQGMAKRQLLTFLARADNNRSPDLQVASQLQSTVSQLKRAIHDHFGQEFLDSILNIYEAHKGGEGNDKWKGLVKI